MAGHRPQGLAARQEASEKAFLLAQGWRLRKVHELDALLDDAAARLLSLETYRDLCERVSGYYIAGRYPPVGTMNITPGDVERDLPAARDFISSMFPGEPSSR